ncbi:MAG: hypothetical protein ACTSSK_10685 [Candidatus Heimdallarchaeota archaeon]
MKIGKQNSILFITIFISSLALGFLFQSGVTTATNNQDEFETNLGANTFGVFDYSFETHVGMYAFDYFNGSIYGVDGSTGHIYVYDAVTGESTANYSIPFTATGIATDGTFLYLTRYTAAQPNGTITKCDLLGNEISRLHIPIGSGLLTGLTWDGTELWAFQNSPQCVIRLNPDNGLITKNITMTGIVIHDLTYFNDILWLCRYGQDSVYTFDPNTGVQTDMFSSLPLLHYDSGIAANETHLMQSRYIDMSDPYIIAFFKLPTEPGDIVTRSYQLLTQVLDCAYDGENIYTPENGSTYVYSWNAGTYGLSTFFDSGIELVGLTVIYDNFILASSVDAPYNLYTFALDGTLLINHTALDVMIRSLAFDGSSVWAMGQDKILYELDPSDMSILSERSVGNLYGITYDYTRDVLWAIDKSDDTINYINTTSGVVGENPIAIDPSITSGEYGLTFNGEYLIVSTVNDGGRFYKIVPGEIDEEDVPDITPTPTPTDPSGLFPGVTPLVEDFIFLGIGAVSVGLIFGVIAIVRRAKK